MLSAADTKRVFLCAVMAFFLSGSCLLYPLALICTKSKVTNIVDRSRLITHDLPGFVRQDPNSQRLQVLRSELAKVLPASSVSGLEKAVAIRKWCSRQQIGGWKENDNSSEDPLALLDRQRRGIGGSCRRFAYVLAGALLAGGMDSRVVATDAGLYDWDPGHTMVEVWIPESRQWVLLDSMADVTYEVDGKPASLLELYEAANSSGWNRITLNRDGLVFKPPAFSRALFHHLLYSMSNAYFDGYHVGFMGPKRLAFAHFGSYGWSQYPERLKNGLFAAAAYFFIAGIFSMLGTVWLNARALVKHLKSCAGARVHYRKSHGSNPATF